MATSADPARLESAQALVRHLRDNPPAAGSLETLCAQFDLPPEFVKTMLDRAMQERPAESHATKRINWLPLVNLGRIVVRSFDRVTAQMEVFLSVSLLSLVALAVLLSVLPHTVPVGNLHRQGGVLELQISNPYLAAATLAVILIQMAAFFRHMSYRDVLRGGLLLWMLSSLVTMTAAWERMQSSQQLARAGIVFVIGLVMFFPSLFYVGLGSAMVTFGGYYKVQKADRQRARMSRHELLEYYFELEKRLKSASSEGTIKRLTDRPPLVWLKALPYQFAVLLGGILSIAYIGVTAAFATGTVAKGHPAAIESIALRAFLNLVSLTFLLSLGYVAGRPRRAFLVALVYALATTWAMFLPIGRYGPAYMMQPSHALETVVASLILALVGAIVGLGAQVQDRFSREASLARNDPSALLGEMLRLQWELADHITPICVMVVDAARSSGMKANSDPLAVEYSFREYQNWIEKLSAGFEGKVHSTAGDGAVVAFSSCGAALRAARALLNDLDRFNREANHLSKPFQLRIGLHVGRITSDIDKVQFTEVIDIAAHVEGRAPIGGIAVTDSMVGELPGEQFDSLSTELDGHAIYVVAKSNS